MTELKKDGRYYAGLTCLVLSFVMPVLGVLLLSLDMPVLIKTVVVGGLSVGGPELMLLAAAAFLGKDTLHFFTARIFQFFYQFLPRQPVSAFQYYTCLTIMVLLQLAWYPYGYFPEYLPAILKDRWVMLAGDFLFILAFLYAGPEFWDKIHHLFHWTGTVSSNHANAPSESS